MGFRRKLLLEHFPGSVFTVSLYVKEYEIVRFQVDEQDFNDCVVQMTDKTLGSCGSTSVCLLIRFYLSLVLVVSLNHLFSCVTNCFKWKFVVLTSI